MAKNRDWVNVLPVPDIPVVKMANKHVFIIIITITTLYTARHI